MCWFVPVAVGVGVHPEMGFMRINCIVTGIPTPTTISITSRTIGCWCRTFGSRQSLWGQRQWVVVTRGTHAFIFTPCDTADGSIARTDEDVWRSLCCKRLFDMIIVECETAAVMPFPWYRKESMPLRFRVWPLLFERPGDTPTLSQNVRSVKGWKSAAPVQNAASDNDTLKFVFVAAGVSNTGSLMAWYSTIVTLVRSTVHTLCK